MIVLVRIAIYVASGLLISYGLPADLAYSIQNELIHPEVVGAVAAVLTVAWWRLAKWMGWRT